MHWVPSSIISSKFLCAYFINQSIHYLTFLTTESQAILGRFKRLASDNENIVPGQISAFGPNEESLKLAGTVYQLVGIFCTLHIML